MDISGSIATTTTTTVHDYQTNMSTKEVNRYTTVRGRRADKEFKTKDKAKKLKTEEKKKMIRSGELKKESRVHKTRELME